MGSAILYTHRRNTASIMKMWFLFYVYLFLSRKSYSGLFIVKVIMVVQKVFPYLVCAIASAVFFRLSGGFL